MNEEDFVRLCSDVATVYAHRRESHQCGSHCYFIGFLVGHHVNEELEPFHDEKYCVRWLQGRRHGIDSSADYPNILRWSTRNMFDGLRTRNL